MHCGAAHCAGGCIFDPPHSWLQLLRLLWACSCSCTAPAHGLSLCSCQGWVRPLQVEETWEITTHWRRPNNENTRRPLMSILTFYGYFYHHAKLHEHPPPRLVFGSFNVPHLGPLVVSGAEGGAELQRPDRAAPPLRGQGAWSRLDGASTGDDGGQSPGAQAAQGPQHGRPRHALHAHAHTHASARTHTQSAPAVTQHRKRRHVRVSERKLTAGYRFCRGRS